MLSRQSLHRSSLISIDTQDGKAKSLSEKSQELREEVIAQCQKFDILEQVLDDALEELHSPIYSAFSSSIHSDSDDQIFNEDFNQAGETGSDIESISVDSQDFQYVFSENNSTAHLRKLSMNSLSTYGDNNTEFSFIPGKSHVSQSSQITSVCTPYENDNFFHNSKLIQEDYESPDEPSDVGRDIEDYGYDQKPNKKSHQTQDSLVSEDLDRAIRVQLCKAKLVYVRSSMSSETSNLVIDSNEFPASLAVNSVNKSTPCFSSKIPSTPERGTFLQSPMSETITYSAQRHADSLILRPSRSIESAFQSKFDFLEKINSFTGVPEDSADIVTEIIDSYYERETEETDEVYPDFGVKVPIKLDFSVVQ
ncbi:hypothetical protein DASC09_058380 [Saccharomycopsis crataegensis]|uniref:Uncharacterized protein n=1 Tax=Saccharomycopsis crataegensis TaxID=43959 RepID=A0AAV5QUT6_9ASCO|nr:hypothetical protein DASC09_058380 [Saccharomycopsis crataegensis]